MINMQIVGKSRQRFEANTDLIYYVFAANLVNVPISLVFCEMWKTCAGRVTSPPELLTTAKIMITAE